MRMYNNAFNGPKLSPAQESDMLSRKDIDGLFQSYMPYVFKVAMRYPMELYEDIVQEGAKGLLEAIHRYDPAKSNGARLSTYGVMWIKCRIVEYIRKQFRHSTVSCADTEQYDHIMDNLHTNISVEDEVLAEEEMTGKQYLASKMNEQLCTLNPRALDVITKRYFNGVPVKQKELGDKYGVSKQQIGNIEKKALKDLRKALTR